RHRGPTSGAERRRLEPRVAAERSDAAARGEGVDARRREEGRGGVRPARVRLLPGFCLTTLSLALTRSLGPIYFLLYDFGSAPSSSWHSSVFAVTVPVTRSLPSPSHAAALEQQ